MIDFNKELYFKTDKFKVLLDRYEKSTSQGEPFYLDPEDLTDIAEYYLYHECDEKALSTIDRAIYTFPSAVEPLLFRSRYALLRENDVEKAKYYAQQIIDTSDYDYKYLHAEILIHEGKPEEADEYLRMGVDDLSPRERADYVYDVVNLFLDYDALDCARKWIEVIDDK